VLKKSKLSIMQTALWSTFICFSSAAFSAPTTSLKASTSAAGLVQVRTAQSAAPTKAKVQKVSTSSKTKPTKAKAELEPVHKARPARGWVLRCGGSSPSWKAEVLAKWIKGSINGQKTSMPITGKSQTHGKNNNVALKTIINGAGPGGQMRLTLRYTRACRGMPFQAKGSFNGQSVTGCCRSVRVY